MAYQARRPEPGASGFLDSLRRLGAALVAILHTRAELLAREFERERMRITRVLVVGIGALFFLALGALTFTMFIIVLFWDTQRLAAIGILTLVYFGIAIALLMYAKSVAASAARPFAATVAELKKDREQFSSNP
jgi:uncharacterized membrane protein YqjE